MIYDFSLLMMNEFNCGSFLIFEHLYMLYEFVIIIYIFFQIVAIPLSAISL